MSESMVRCTPSETSPGRIRPLHCLRQKRRSGYTTTSTREQFMTKNPAYTAEPVVAPAGPTTGGTGLGALKTDEAIVRFIP